MAPGKLQRLQGMAFECRGTLEGERMCMVDPRSFSELSCDPVRSVSDKLVCGQISFSDVRGGKDIVMFDAGASTSNVCPMLRG